MDTPPDILFDGSNVAVRNEIAEKLWNLEIPNLAIQPAIYIDHKNKWYENHWFLTFTAEFDCWDRAKSFYDPDPVSTEPPSYAIFTYSLNEQLLDCHVATLLAMTMLGIVATRRDVANPFISSLRGRSPWQSSPAFQLAPTFQKNRTAPLRPSPRRWFREGFI
jgi:hypothetical protein